MPHIDKHAPGAFCWIELGTLDQEAAKRFYGALLGWSPHDFPIGPGGVYTMFQLDGRDAAAAFTLPPEMAGAPPHWMLYVAVASASDAAARAGALGGKVIRDAFDASTYGRMAVLQDPTGAPISVWEPKDHPGIGIYGVPGTLCWADLHTPNVERAAAFYSGLFPWVLSAAEKDPSGYLHIRNGENFIGGIPPAAYRDPRIPPHWLAYFSVEDVDAAASRAAGMGAKLLVPPMTMEHVGRWAVIQDPQGAVFAVFSEIR